MLLFGSLIGAFAFIFSDTGGAKTATVPSIVGMNQAAAGDALRAAKLTPQFSEIYDNTVPRNTVISANPPVGTTLQPNATVSVVLSKGRPIVPSIAPGTSESAAETAIKAAQLTPVRGTDEFSDAPQGTVARVEPGAGSQLEINAQVNLIISKGPEPLAPVPDVRGRSKDDAFAILQQNGFQPFQAGEEFSQDFAAGQVTRTDPQGGSQTSTRRIGVFVSNAVEVPDVRFRSFDDAEKILKQAGLKPDRDKGGRGGGGVGFVFDQDPAPGTKVQKGTTVKLKGFGGG